MQRKPLLFTLIAVLAVGALDSPPAGATAAPPVLGPTLVRRHRPRPAKRTRSRTTKDSRARWRLTVRSRITDPDRTRRRSALRCSGVPSSTCKADNDLDPVQAVDKARQLVESDKINAHLGPIYAPAAAAVTNTSRGQEASRRSASWAGPATT